MGDTSLQASSVPLKYDWYQTEAVVAVAILVKDVAKDEVAIKFAPTRVQVEISLPDSTRHSKHLRLPHEVDPEACSYSVLKSKVEIKLKKLEAIRWSELESKDEESTEPAPALNVASCASSGPPAYPTSKPGKDWSAIEKDIKEQEEKEKPEAEDALNKMFQQIYGKGDDSVKRAMNKSYMESGGTVLSTNWNEISKDKVPVKPPSGMEWKEWDS